MRAFACVLLAAVAACHGGQPRLEPSSGSVRGGDAIRITGEGFAGHGPVVVEFGGVAARGVVIESDNLVRVRAPAVPEPATVDVALEFADGTRVELPGSFEFHEGQGVVIAPAH